MTGVNFRPPFLFGLFLKAVLPHIERKQGHGGHTSKKHWQLVIIKKKRENIVSPVGFAPSQNWKSNYQIEQGTIHSDVWRFATSLRKTHISRRCENSAGAPPQEPSTFLFFCFFELPTPFPSHLLFFKQQLFLRTDGGKQWNRQNSCAVNPSNGCKLESKRFLNLTC